MADCIKCHQPQTAAPVICPECYRALTERTETMENDKLIKDLRQRGLRNGTSLGHHSGLCDEAADCIEALTVRLAEKDKQLGLAVEDSDFRKNVELTPLYTCGGHDYLDDDDEDFWCPVCREHLGRNRHETTCPRCGQEINSDAEPCWDYDELRGTEYDRLPKNWERGPQEAGEDGG